MKTLIVDDKAENLYLLERLLKKIGHQVTIAENGKEALGKMRADSFDLVISDILMPVMDGFQFCREVRADDTLKNVAFVFYTATYTDKKDEELALKMGADKFIRKPMEPDKFMGIIEEVIKDTDKLKGEHTKPDDKKEKEDLKLYSERLVTKLEKKMFQLEAEIAERKQVEEGLRQSEKQLRTLAARLQEVEEAERKRLSRELHDQVGQNLTALNINLNILRSQLPAELLEKMADRLSDSAELVEETTERIRDVMADLRPEVLDDYGLVAALRWYGERFSERTGMATIVHGNEPSPRMSEAVESALFRIAQEALTNVAKHAGGRQVSVNFEENDGIFRLTIADDGKGFASIGLSSSEKQKGWGFLTMQERAQAVGGKVQVESEPGKGTRIIVEVER